MAAGRRDIFTKHVNPCVASTFIYRFTGRVAEHLQVCGWVGGSYKLFVVLAEVVVTNRCVAEGQCYEQVCGREVGASGRISHCYRYFLEYFCFKNLL